MAKLNHDSQSKRNTNISLSIYKLNKKHYRISNKRKWPDPELNRRHKDFQS